MIGDFAEDADGGTHWVEVWVSGRQKRALESVGDRGSCRQPQRDLRHMVRQRDNDYDVDVDGVLDHERGWYDWSARCTNASMNVVAM